MARTIVNTAKPHDAHTRSLLPTVPSSGNILRRVLRDDIPALPRFPRVQEVVASCPLVQCATASGGTRVGTAGATSGQAHLQWACAAAAIVGLRAHRAAQTSRARLEQKPAKGQAWPILAQQLARAVSYRRQRNGAVERETGFQR